MQCPAGGYEVHVPGFLSKAMGRELGLNRLHFWIQEGAWVGKGLTAFLGACKFLPGSSRIMLLEHFAIRLGNKPMSLWVQVWVLCLGQRRPGSVIAL